MEMSEANAKGSLRELVTHWCMPLVITTSLSVFQQLTGNSNILAYTADIFRLSGIRGTAPAVVLGMIKVIATLVAILKVSHCL